MRVFYPSQIESGLHSFAGRRAFSHCERSPRASVAGAMNGLNSVTSPERTHDRGPGEEIIGTKQK